MQNYINYTDNYTDKNEVNKIAMYLFDFIKTMKINGDIPKKDYKKNRRNLSKVMKICRKDDSTIIEYCEDVFYIKRKIDKVYKSIDKNINKYHIFKSS
jgi:hypothetical protein